MEVKAQGKFIRMSPRKVRLVANLVRGKKLSVALGQLKFVGKEAANPVLKVIESAAANARHNFELSDDNLFIKEIRIDGGPTLSRWLPRAHGRATPINKRTSHINVTLAEINDSGARVGRKVSVEAPMKLGTAPAHEEGVKVDEKKISKPKEAMEEKDKKIIDTRREGRNKGFTSKFFNRKSG
jgi:large subunit ribosomal protein L22